MVHRDNARRLRSLANTLQIFHMPACPSTVSRHCIACSPQLWGFSVKNRPQLFARWGWGASDRDWQKNWGGWPLDSSILHRRKTTRFWVGILNIRGFIPWGTDRVKVCIWALHRCSIRKYRYMAQKRLEILQILDHGCRRRKWWQTNVVTRFVEQHLAVLLYKKKRRHQKVPQSILYMYSNLNQILLRKIVAVGNVSIFQKQTLGF